MSASNTAEIVAIRPANSAITLLVATAAQLSVTAILRSGKVFANGTLRALKEKEIKQFGDIKLS